MGERDPLLSFDEFVAKQSQPSAAAALPSFDEFAAQQQKPLATHPPAPKPPPPGFVEYATQATPPSFAEFSKNFLMHLAYLTATGNDGVAYRKEYLRVMNDAKGGTSELLWDALTHPIVTA